MNRAHWLRFWSPDAWRVWRGRREDWQVFKTSQGTSVDIGPGAVQPPRPVSPAWFPGALLVALIAITSGGEAPPNPTPQAPASNTTLSSSVTAELPTTTTLSPTTTSPTVTTSKIPVGSFPQSDLLLAAPGPGPSGDPEGPSPQGAQQVTVASITDGDTIDVTRQDGTTETVRLIGINTPESNECFASEATAVLEVLTPPGAQVGMTVDVSDVDQYDRLLRYLWLGGMSINEEMVRRGAAISRRYQPDTAQADRFEEAQSDAKESHLGLWAPEACGPRVDASLSIAGVEYDPPGNENDNLNQEWVTIRNDGDNVVDLTGWMIKDESASNRFAFPTLFALAPGELVTVHSGCGDPFGAVLYWCSVGAAVWNNDGDTVFLLDPNGNAHNTHNYAGATTTSTTLSPPTTELGFVGGGADCDPSYPDVCIPSYPPDLNCGDIPHKRFAVLQPDPHGFDRDNDGVGCES